MSNPSKPGPRATPARSPANADADVRPLPPPASVSPLSRLFQLSSPTDEAAAVAFSATSEEMEVLLSQCASTVFPSSVQQHAEQTHGTAAGTADDGGVTSGSLVRSDSQRTLRQERGGRRTLHCRSASEGRWTASHDAHSLVPARAASTSSHPSDDDAVHSRFSHSDDASSISSTLVSAFACAITPPPAPSMNKLRRENSTGFLARIGSRRNDGSSTSANMPMPEERRGLTFPSTSTAEEEGPPHTHHRGRRRAASSAAGHALAIALGLRSSAASPVSNPPLAAAPPVSNPSLAAASPVSNLPVAPPSCPTTDDTSPARPQGPRLRKAGATGLRRTSSSKTVKETQKEQHQQQQQQRSRRLGGWASTSASRMPTMPMPSPDAPSSRTVVLVQTVGARPAATATATAGPSSSSSVPFNPSTSTTLTSTSTPTSTSTSTSAKMAKFIPWLRRKGRADGSAVKAGGMLADVEADSIHWEWVEPAGSSSHHHSPSVAAVAVAVPAPAVFVKSEEKAAFKSEEKTTFKSEEKATFGGIIRRASSRTKSVGANALRAAVGWGAVEPAEPAKAGDGDHSRTNEPASASASAESTPVDVDVEHLFPGRRSDLLLNAHASLAPPIQAAQRSSTSLDRGLGWVDPASSPALSIPGGAARGLSPSPRPVMTPTLYALPDPSESRGEEDEDGAGNRTPRAVPPSADHLRDELLPPLPPPAPGSASLVSLETPSPNIHPVPMEISTADTETEAEPDGEEEGEDGGRRKGGGWTSNSTSSFKPVVGTPWLLGQPVPSAGRRERQNGAPAPPATPNKDQDDGPDERRFWSPLLSPPFSPPLSGVGTFGPPSTPSSPRKKEKDRIDAALSPPTSSLSALSRERPRSSKTLGSSGDGPPPTADSSGTFGTVDAPTPTSTNRNSNSSNRASYPARSGAQQLQTRTPHPHLPRPPSDASVHRHLLFDAYVRGASGHRRRSAERLSAPIDVEEKDDAESSLLWNHSVLGGQTASSVTFAFSAAAPSSAISVVKRHSVDERDVSDVNVAAVADAYSDVDVDDDGSQSTSPAESAEFPISPMTNSSSPPSPVEKIAMAHIVRPPRAMPSRLTRVASWHVGEGGDVGVGIGIGRDTGKGRGTGGRRESIELQAGASAYEFAAGRHDPIVVGRSAPRVLSREEMERERSAGRWTGLAAAAGHSCSPLSSASASAAAPSAVVSRVDDGPKFPCLVDAPGVVGTSEAPPSAWSKSRERALKRTQPSMETVDDGRSRDTFGARRKERSGGSSGRRVEERARRSNRKPGGGADASDTGLLLTATATATTTTPRRVAGASEHGRANVRASLLVHNGMPKRGVGDEESSVGEEEGEQEATTTTRAPRPGVVNWVETQRTGQQAPSVDDKVALTAPVSNAVETSAEADGHGRHRRDRRAKRERGDGGDQDRKSPSPSPSSSVKNGSLSNRRRREEEKRMKNERKLAERKRKDPLLHERLGLVGLKMSMPTEKRRDGTQAVVRSERKLDEDEGAISRPDYVTDTNRPAASGTLHMGRRGDHHDLVMLSDSNKPPPSSLFVVSPSSPHRIARNASVSPSPSGVSAAYITADEGRLPSGSHSDESSSSHSENDGRNGDSDNAERLQSPPAGAKTLQHSVRMLDSMAAGGGAISSHRGVSVPQTLSEDEVTTTFTTPPNTAESPLVAAHHLLFPKPPSRASPVLDGEGEEVVETLRTGAGADARVVRKIRSAPGGPLKPESAVDASPPRPPALERQLTASDGA